MADAGCGVGDDGGWVWLTGIHRSISRAVGRASLPLLGPEVPRSGGPISRALGRWVLALIGWHVEGEFPNLPKFVVIVAPHTSNWDFVIGMGAKLALSIAATWIGKDTIFRFPFDGLLRSLGGMPVDRSSANAVVQQIADEFGRRPRMVFALAPEGTRKRVERWRTGFYHIARAAGVPIVPVAFDWSTRAVRIMPPFTTTGNAESDIAALQRMFAGLR